MRVPGMFESSAASVVGVAQKRAAGGPAAPSSDVPKAPSVGQRSYEVSLTGGAGGRSSDVYAPPKAPVGGYMTFNQWGSGDVTSLGSASGPTRLEYNVYRPDSIVIDGSTNPYTVVATGEPLTEDVKRKLDEIVHAVTKQRIEIYKSGKEAGLSVSDIRDRLIAFDHAQPASYRNLVGNFYSTDPATRYMNWTHDELMGGPRQAE